MWALALPWWELILRSLFVYGFLLALLRLSDKRQVGQLAPFDLVLLLVLSNAVQNAMNAGETSMTAGMLSATTLICLNWLVSLATDKSKQIEALIEGQPKVLIHNGQLDETALRQEKLTHHEIMAALREAGYSRIEQMHATVLENNGHVSVQLKQVQLKTATTSVAAPHQAPDS